MNEKKEMKKLPGNKKDLYWLLQEEKQRTIYEQDKKLHEEQQKKNKNDY